MTCRVFIGHYVVYPVSLLYTSAIDMISHDNLTLSLPESDEKEIEVFPYSGKKTLI